MGQTLPEKPKGMYQTLVEGFQKASVGPYACDLIETGETCYDWVVDEFAALSRFPKPETMWRCAYCRVTHMGDAHLTRCQYCGAPRTDDKPPTKWLKFMGADVVRKEIPDNEVRFLNSKRPDVNHVITI